MKIKHWLIAGKHNHYHPKLLRPTGLALIAACLLGINLAYNLTNSGHWQVLGYATDISSGEIINLTNQQRISNGLAPLSSNAQLNQAALNNANYMFAHDYWAHYAPDGTSPWSFITATGYAYAAAGQNLAKDFYSSSDVVSAWMNSPEHRANILNGSYVDTGVAVVNGTLEGEQTTLVVAFYAEPQAAPAPAPAPSTPPSAPTTATPTQTTGPEASQPTPPSTTTTPSPSAQAPTTTKASQPPASSPTKQPDQTIAGESAKAIAAEPVSTYQRNWAQNATLFVLLMVLLLLILRHTVVWRSQRRGWRHIWLRAHPAAQYALIIVAIVANIVTGVGVVL